MQLVQNVIIVTLCVDSRHTFFTFCVNGIRSVSNDKHFVSCYDRWHNYSIVLIFDELLIFYFFLFFFINIAVGFRLFVIHRRSQRDIFLRRPCIRPSTPYVHPHFCPSGTISQYLFVILESFFVQMICTIYSRYPISFVKTNHWALEL